MKQVRKSSLVKNKTPTVTDIIQAAQLEEEMYERSEMDKMTLNLNNMNVIENENDVFAIEEQEGDQNMEETQYQELAGAQHSPEFNEGQYHHPWANRSGWKPNQERRNDQRRYMGIDEQDDQGSLVQSVGDEHQHQSQQGDDSHGSESQSLLDGYKPKQAKRYKEGEVIL